MAEDTSALIEFAKALTVDLVLLLAWYREYKRANELQEYILARKTRQDTIEEQTMKNNVHPS